MLLFGAQTALDLYFRLHYRHDHPTQHEKRKFKIKFCFENYKLLEYRMHIETCFGAERTELTPLAPTEVRFATHTPQKTSNLGVRVTIPSEIDQTPLLVILRVGRSLKPTFVFSNIPNHLVFCSFHYSAAARALSERT